MSEKYKFNNPDGLYFITSTIVYWIDLFTRKEYMHVLMESLQYYQNKRNLNIHAFCIMPSHLHMIISSKNSNEKLGDIMRDFKKLSNRKLIEEIKNINESRKDWLLRAFEKAASKLKRIKSNKLWQDGNHPIELIDSAMLQQKLDYIHYNPVESEIVDQPEDYKYSSAKEYAGIRKGFLDIALL